MVEDINNKLDLAAVFDAAEKSNEASAETLQSAEEKARVEETIRFGMTRSAIAICIIGTYALAILGAVLYIMVSAPSCSGGDGTVCAALLGAWEKQSELLMNLIVTAVLPIVTLMLGFYFGTETSNASNQSNGS